MSEEVNCRGPMGQVHSSQDQIAQIQNLTDQLSVYYMHCAL